MPERPQLRMRSMPLPSDSSLLQVPLATDPSQKTLGIRQRAPASLTPAKRLKYWCTGKDSNLRTSLGGTDLQSVGFNHSPTCAKLPGEAVAAHHPPSDQATHTNFCRRLPDFAKQISQIRETKNRAIGLPREDHYKPDKVPNGVRWKNLLRRHLPRPLPAGNSLPEIRFRTFAYWSWRRDLNPRPPDYKSGALPTELRQHSGNRALQAQVYP
jgi:hypothetical protein